MAKISGYTLYTCDRDRRHTAFAQDDEPEADGWYEVRRTDRNGQSVTRLLCNKCFSDYQKLVEAQDKEFAEFMGGFDV